MKQIVVKKDCIIKNKKYVAGDLFKATKQDMFLLCKLNEKGFIVPLTKEELLEISSSFKSKRKKEEL